MTAHPDASVQALFEAARLAQSRAYAPYSHFPVGAAIRSSSGAIYAGCNIENAAYPQGWCAEASAIAVMVSAGEREIAEVLTIADGAQLSTCCGGCRQKLREFAPLSTPVHAAGPEGVRRTFTLDELLPHSFGPENLSGF
jgi:cytidine deaminase